MFWLHVLEDGNIILLILMEINKLAVETCFWPLYEVIDGKYIINYKPKNKLPVKDFLKAQGRFKHLFQSRK